jgi:hypothetical protein
MIQVKIYKPAKTTMQSGRSKTKAWILEYELDTKRQPEPLMGWVSSGDTLNQVRIAFDSKEEALAFAGKKGWQASVIEPKGRILKGRTYLDNFKYTPPGKNTSSH